MIFQTDFHGQWDKKTGHVAPLYFHEDDDFAYFNANYSISVSSTQISFESNYRNYKASGNYIIYTRA